MGTRLENSVKFSDKTPFTKILVPEKKTMKSRVFEAEIAFFSHQKVPLVC